VYIVQQLECAGHAVHTIIIDDLDTLVAELANVEPVKEETYPTGPRKTIYLDPDGNEIGFGEVPSGLLGYVRHRFRDRWRGSQRRPTCRSRKGLL
jgi:hypothetical protein